MEEDTAITARNEVKKAINWPTRIMAFLVGITAAIGPIIAGWYGVVQAKIAADAAREASKKEASKSYETLADPLEGLRQDVKKLDERIERLEDEHSARESLAPISPQPLLDPGLNKPVPKTLVEATKE